MGSGHMQEALHGHEGAWLCALWAHRQLGLDRGRFLPFVYLLAVTLALERLPWEEQLLLSTLPPAL